MTIDLAAKVKNIYYEESQREYLTLEEFNQLAATPCDSEIFKRASLFSALTGLRHSDIKQLKWRDIVKDKEHYQLHFTQQKTKGVENMPISNQAYSLCGERGDTNRYQNILNRFITEGRVALSAFVLSNRTNFNDKEAASIYYGIMAVAHKMELSLDTKESVTSAVNNILSGMSWRDCSIFNEECVTNWTHLFAERDVTYEPLIIDNFISFVDYMSCNAETNTSHGGSNGCADQLTTWDGTKKLGLDSQTKKKDQSY